MNEIDGNGNVVQLNSTAVSTSERAPSPAAPAPACSERGNIEPNTAPEAAVVAPEAPPHASADVTAPPGYAQFLSGLDKLLPSEGVAAVQQFLTAVEAYERSWADADAPSDADAPAEKLSSAERVKPPLPITFAVSSNKDERTAVHHFFKQPGLPKCSTETMPAGENGENCMRLCYHAQVTPPKNVCMPCTLCCSCYSVVNEHLHVCTFRLPRCICPFLVTENGP